jgi:hypothetical protein
MDWICSSVGECLPAMHKALDLIPNITQKESKKNKKKKEERKEARKKNHI